MDGVFQYSVMSLDEKVLETNGPLRIVLRALERFHVDVWERTCVVERAKVNSGAEPLQRPQRLEDPTDFGRLNNFSLGDL